MPAPDATSGSTTVTTPATSTGYRHEALVYRGAADYVAQVVRFLRDGARREEAMLVAVPEPRLSLLRSSVAEERELIEFVDMAVLGANPARVVPRWLAFVEESGGRPIRGVGEPLWNGRPADELAECQLNEALVNAAVPPGSPFRLLCPYDRTTLSAAVLRECETGHPVVHDGPAGRARRSRWYAGGAHAQTLLRRRLPEPGVPTTALAVTRADQRATFARARRLARDLGAGEERGRAFAGVVTDIVGEWTEDGGRPVQVRLWRSDDRVVGEIRSGQPLTDPFVGRRPPAPGAPGRGVWLANQVCDLAQVRGDEQGTVVRLQVAVAGPPS